ncbi:TPA: Blp family class II bacteriocin [Streptococcus pneumoniae]
MNTKMLSQLEVMDTEMLAKVEGGYSSTDCQNALITGVTTGIITGGTGAGLATLGVAGLAGAFVGAHIGAIGRFCQSRCWRSSSKRSSTRH